MCLIADFEIIRPRFESQQEDTFEWLIAAHTQAEDTIRGKRWEAEEREAFRQTLSSLLQRVGCKANEYRGHVLADFLHQNWTKMDIYKLDEQSIGAHLETRQKMHREIADEMFERFYPAAQDSPQAIVHVSCTGYSSPSAAQTLVSKRLWGKGTSVTNAFHMGCYGSIPALQIAKGFSLQHYPRVDIVHTELCTLHFNATLHTAEQLVMQSLFSDGFIKYSIFPESTAKDRAFRLLAIHQEVIPQSLDFMTWLLSDWGFHFTLAKEVPFLIAEHVKAFVETLCHKKEVDSRSIIQKSFFAIHPGGPRIIDQIQQVLGLHDDQVAHSRDILRRYGNMSSATLPHVWESMLNDREIPPGTKIFSLAFGPGITIAGNLLEKTA